MFAKYGTYPPAGLFTATHIVAIIVSLAIIAVLLFVSRNISVKGYYFLIKIFAVILTGLELIKIVWTVAQGETAINNWVPLYFCSLFIYALWMVGFKNQTIREIGLSFIAFAGAVAGLVFIFFPTTSFKSYPVWHFKCLHSMIYHIAMVYLGLLFYFVIPIKLKFKHVVFYWLFCLFFMIQAFVLNINYGSNLMFISNPGVIPLAVFPEIYKFSHILYSTIIVVAHLSLGVVLYLIFKLYSSKSKGYLEEKVNE